MIILEDFAKRALRRISPIYEDSEFIKEFFNGISFDAVRNYFLKLREQSFIETVDAFIEYQEYKYSLTPRPDLTLEQRRARLGIKARQYYPINPARLEKTIYDNFGVATYLSEQTPGLIEMIFNRTTQDGYYKTVEFLLREKPAHLDLSTWLNWVVPIGGGNDDEDNDRVVIRPDNIPLPKSEADKKNFPRLFAGVAEGIAGTVTVGLATPDDSLWQLYVGEATAFVGDVTIEIDPLPPNELMPLNAGVGMFLSGEITIDTDEEPFKPRYIENPTPRLAMAGGMRQRTSAQTLLRSSRPRLLGAENYVPSQAALYQCFGAIARGAPLYYSPPPDFGDDEWDIVKIFFDFPISRHRRVRGIAMPNARSDLTREEIKAVGQYAVDNKLIMNSLGEVATKVTRAALKTKDVTKVF